MANCSFCDAKEEKEMPLCQSCGALRYPVANSAVPTTASRQQKLKLSAALAVTLVTPGSFVVLAVVGANKLNSKLKRKSNKR